MVIGGWAFESGHTGGWIGERESGHTGGWTFERVVMQVVVQA